MIPLFEYDDTVTVISLNYIFCRFFLCPEAVLNSKDLMLNLPVMVAEKKKKAVISVTEIHQRF